MPGSPRVGDWRLPSLDVRQVPWNKLGPNGCNHWWIKPVNTFLSLCAGIAASPRSFACYIGSVAALGRAVLRAEKVALKKLTAAPFAALGASMLFQEKNLVLGLAFGGILVIGQALGASFSRWFPY